MTKEKLSDEKIQKLLNDVRTGKAKVEPAPQNEILILRPYVIKILKAIGHPEAWVSDLSSIGDFRPINGNYDKYVAKVSVKLGFIVNKGDSIINLATQLKARDPDT